ncbi:MAG: HipA domain-containing protein [Coriobacteriales bacterium]|jgi:hypothetical protein|nr:HipA domain-containing protein [Coriobacteriales bacterium]
MIEIKEYDDRKVVRSYGGRSGTKFGVAADDDIWLLKFPKTTKEMAKADVSYTTSPLSEYLGSHIYASLGIPVHETGLALRDGKIVVACKDFLMRGDKLIEFMQIKNIHGFDVGGTSTSGEGVDLKEVLDTIMADEWLMSLEGSIDRFWDMFVVDAVIGNNDRNNGNWGIIERLDENIELAPVYGNGNAFFNKRGGDKMLARLANKKEFEQDAFGTVTSVYTHKLTNGDAVIDKHIKPFDFMSSTNDVGCLAAMNRFAARYDHAWVSDIIDSIPESYRDLAVMPQPMKTAYKKLLAARSERVILLA